MTDVQLFQFGTSEIRVIDRQGEPWFVAKDVCDVLEIENVSQALTRLDEDERNTIILNEGIGNPQKGIINESGLYSLVLSSRKPEAKAFKKWVTSEVLPTIRKHGGYLTPEKTQELINNPDLIIEMAQRVKHEQEKRRQAELLAERNEEIIKLQDKVILEVQPKVQYYEQVLAAEDGILTNVIAKELGMSAHTLNKKLKEMGVIYRQGESWLLYHKYQGKGLTKTKTYTYTGSDGKQHTNIQTVWTQKGRELIHQLIETNE
jgi:prophage antirepressor-like protein